MKLKCVCCDSMEGVPREVGDEMMPLCPEHDWGVDDINAANRAGERFGAKLHSLGMKLRALYRGTPPEKPKGYLH